MYMDHIFLMHSSVEGHPGSFYSLVTVAIAAINIGVQMALLFTTSVSLGQIPSSGNDQVIGKFYF